MQQVLTLEYGELEKAGDNEVTTGLKRLLLSDGGSRTSTSDRSESELEHCNSAARVQVVLLI